MPKRFTGLTSNDCDRHPYEIASDCFETAKDQHGETELQQSAKSKNRQNRKQTTFFHSFFVVAINSIGVKNRKS
ncbi:Hypothetical predicted protein [Octopus vulgaris]|uniref:Uncharacterized protein n=1 Tax=Octopus vulgaris TaxID=6645 RepID=A0AA36F3P5_OCTVU|nr:Hypothetical predicted protein [Octopus vulgaris]